MITLAVVSILTPMTDKVEGSDVGDSPWWLTSVAAARVSTFAARFARVMIA